MLLLLGALMLGAAWVYAVTGWAGPLIRRENP